MTTPVRIGLIQAAWHEDADTTVLTYERLIDQAALMGVQVACLPELFHTPYFTAKPDSKWCEIAEPIPGPLSSRMARKAQEHEMVLVVPMYERDMTGVYYNAAIVLNCDGTLVGKYRKVHIPLREDCFEKFYFRPGNLGFPVFGTRWIRIGVCICYDRHFPEALRALGLNGAEIVFAPTASRVGLFRGSWEAELKMSALVNGYFTAYVNRVGTEQMSDCAVQFFGASCASSPRGEILAIGSEQCEEVVVSDIDVDTVAEVRRMFSFYRDRRPETYQSLVEP
jgi:N-carbamoylputrescine amidase